MVSLLHPSGLPYTFPRPSSARLTLNFLTLRHHPRREEHIQSNQTRSLPTYPSSSRLSSSLPPEVSLETPSSDHLRLLD